MVTIPSFLPSICSNIFSVFLSEQHPSYIVDSKIIFSPNHEMVSQHQECSLQAALTPNVKGERVLLTVDMATICAQDYFLSFREYMHAHAGKTEDKQHGSNAGVNDTTSQQPSNRPCHLTPVLRRRGSTGV